MFKLYKKEDTLFVQLGLFESIEEAISHAESVLSAGDIFTIEEDTLFSCKVVKIDEVQ